MMQCDGKIVVVDVPELLKDCLGLAAGVDEDERGLMRVNEPVDFIKRVPRRMPSPWQPFAGVEHRDIRRRAGLGDDEIGGYLRRWGLTLRHHEAGELRGFGNGR